MKNNQTFQNKNYEKISVVLCFCRSLMSGLISSVAQSYPTLCDPIDCSTPGFPVHQQLQELTATHVHRVGDGQGGLVCCSPWGCKKLDTTE